jgi:phosphoenolpyruvate-protein phosphotransferase (PTS system enzyme I)
MTEQPKEQVFRGTAVGDGIAIGRIFVLTETVAKRRAQASPEAERTALQDALDQAKCSLERLIAEQDELAGEILEFQLALLDDPELITPIFKAIERGVPADRAWAERLDAETRSFAAGGDAQLAARADDLSDLKLRVLGRLSETDHNVPELPLNSIVVARDLTPSRFLGLDFKRIAGAAVLNGSPTSHVAILARSRGLNLLVGTEPTLIEVRQGSPAILDASLGCVTVNPTKATLAAGRACMARSASSQTELAELAKHQARTASNEPVAVYVNVDVPDTIESVTPDICDGIGLTRTEFLFADGYHPSEEEQLAFDEKLITWAQGRPVTIRTLDAGGDKPLSGITIENETNPFLGLRGVRLSFTQPELFRTQLRALSRAAAVGNVRVMLPMVTEPQEVAHARTMMLEETKSLRDRNIACADPAIGIMVEVPAAAIAAADFPADFYSIGSNDLIQYTTASARDNPRVADLASPRNKAVLKLIAMTVEAGAARSKEVSLCGDMASMPEMIEDLLTTGLRALSCVPAQVGAVKSAISRSAPPRRRKGWLW